MKEASSYIFQINNELKLLLMTHAKDLIRDKIGP